MCNINPKIKEHLKQIIDDVCKNNEYNEACRDFLIQYTVFDNEGSDGWYMNCSIDGTCDEGLYEIDVEYNDTTTVEIWSRKGNFSGFDYYNFEDDRGCSDSDSIYTVDLYDEFKPKNYKGEVCTRGGFNGWNWFSSI